MSRPGSDIRLGDLVKATEPSFALVECYRSDAECPVSDYCRLPPILDNALAAFLDALNQHTLADVSLPRVPVADATTPRKPVRPRRARDLS